jgi:hypothetical protein
MAEKPNNFGICECGDPSCKCAPGKCDCKQPSDKFLPKEDKGDFGGAINAPVNPTLSPAQQKGPLNAMGIPSDKTSYKDKQAATAEAGKEAFTFWAPALLRLQAQMSENIEKMASSPNTKFYSKACSWKIGKDGMREVSYNYIEEVKTPINVSGSMASSPKQMVPAATWDRKLVLSKHLDDKSAMLACQVYNDFLNLK